MCIRLCLLYTLFSSVLLLLCLGLWLCFVLFCFFGGGGNGGGGCSFHDTCTCIQTEPPVKFNRITKICKIHVHSVSLLLAGTIITHTKKHTKRSNFTDLNTNTWNLFVNFNIYFAKILLSNIPRGTRGTILYECSPVTCYYVKKKLLQKLIRNCILIYFI